MKRKTALILALVMAVFSFSVGAEQLTDEANGTTGDISVKYDNQISPLALVAGKVMNLTVTIFKPNALSNAQMYVALYDEARLIDVKLANGTETAVTGGYEYAFANNIQLPDDVSNCYMKIFLWHGDQKPAANQLKLINILYPIIYTYNAANRIETVMHRGKITTYYFDDNGSIAFSETAEAMPMSFQNTFALSQMLRAMSFNSLTDGNETTGFNTVESNTGGSAVIGSTAPPEWISSVETVTDADNNSRTVTTYDLSLADENQLTVEN